MRIILLYWQRLALVLALAALALANENLVGCLGRLHYNTIIIIIITLYVSYWLLTTVNVTGS